MKRLTILFLVLFMPFVVYADDTSYHVTIDKDKNITIYPEIDSIDRLLTYENDVLTLKEGAKINNIYTFVPLTITSNNKEVELDSISGNPSQDENVKNSITMVNLYNTSDKNGYISFYDKLVVIDSHFRSMIFYSSDYSVEGNVVEIRNTTFDGDYGLHILLSKGDIFIDNSKLNVDLIDSDHGSIRIKDSQLYPTVNIYAEGDGANLIIENSSIIKRSENPHLFIASYSGDSKPLGFIIKDSYIDVGSIYTNNSSINGSNAEIINSTVKVTGGYFDILLPLNIIDSTIDVKGSRFGQNSTMGMSLINSKITFQSDADNSSNYIGTISLNNSYISFNKPLTIDSLLLNNSYFYGTNNNPDKSVLTIRNSLEIKNSRFFLDNKVNYPAIFFSHDSSYTLGKDSYFTDKDYNMLNIITGTYDAYVWPTGNVTYNHYELVYPTDSDKIVTSVLTSSSATITFKVVNGTWADGTTDDVVITKEVWTKLQKGEIPSVLSNTLGGSWDNIPDLDEYVKGNQVYTYTYEQVKGIEENPKTGLFNDILLFIPVIISILGFNYLKKLEFFKKM